jgi:hypothetical protein
MLFPLAAGEMDLQCFNIDYFPKEEYSPDPNDSTMAIPCKYQGCVFLGSGNETVSLSGVSHPIKDGRLFDFV